MGRRVVVLVDGDHHADAVRAALADLRRRGDDPVCACYLGGTEKVAASGATPDLGVRTVWPTDALQALPRLVGEHRPAAVVDLTADPVTDDRARARLVAVTLDAGVPYEAAGARWTPPSRPALTARPTVAVIATNKRAGKTAVSGALARAAAAAGRRPVIVAMGRGGPPAPVVLPAGQKLTVDRLLAVARDGGHAASDFYEDAVMTGAATVGCRRVGEGPSGEVGFSNVGAGVAAAVDLDADLVLLEGSGAALPPAHADATVLVVPATIDPVALHAMLPLRFLLADLVVVTLADDRAVPAGQVATLMATLETVFGALPDAGAGRPPLGVAVTRFRPHPLEPVAGRHVLVATTAPRAASPGLVEDLRALGADVVGVTHDLADRAALRRALVDAPDHDLLVTELKAAAVDVAAAAAARRGATTVFYDNRPVDVPLPRPRHANARPLATGFSALVAAAIERAADRAVTTAEGA